MTFWIPQMIRFPLSNEDTSSGKDPDLSENRISGSQHHEEADTEADPPPHNYPLLQCSLVGFYSFIIRTIKQNSFPIYESIEPPPP